MTRLSLSLSASLVLYKPDLATLERTLLALQEAGRVAKEDGERFLELTLVDNSSDAVLHERIGQWLDARRSAMPDWTVHLLRSPGNVGYGRGNNLAIEGARSDYHLVVNPDLFVAPDALREALRFLEDHPDAGLLTPAVFGEDGERHYLCKRHPTLLVMFLRSFSPKWLQSWFEPTLAEFEMLDCDYEKPIFDVEYPTGACMFFRTSVLHQIRGFDPDYFLHYEDADIGRRALQVARVIYVPKVKVVHQWARDTHRSWASRLVTIRSGFLYWRKWGGVFSTHPDADVTKKTSAKNAMRAKTSGARQPGAFTGAGKIVLVTGANGFVGTAVCSVLTSRAYQVRGVVRHKQHVASDDGLEGLSMNEIDENTDWSVALAGVDSVVHLAARVHLMREVAADPLAEFRRTNVALTLNLARQAAAAGVRRFVFISSIKVNGEVTPVGQPFTAEDVPHPTDPYGISKHEAEQGLLQLAAETGLEVVIIRPVLVYGRGVKANFQSMMHWLLKGLPMPLGALPNRRSLVALGNLADLIAICIQHPAAANQVFLASDGEDLSISGLLSRTGAALDKPARLISVPVMVLKGAARVAGQEAVMQRLCDSLQVDISKTRRVLGWEPPVDVDDALREAAQYFRHGSP
ncbi:MULTISPECIES: NAD-dependent epimerase/dehydratase family protein [unclassified Polaromonas]|uniref:NAD-dependent epimerase/dehydratase family protein n=1 Tax=unclassified Polaromonas TaxID=2638319 RepID=UPI000F07DE25|nr:NAD-dependent epimerase/dehydratase family protein [Polaromonas sp. SP1]QGJ17985.1 NAD-dependent epimerase/dehydratase family protein [Polaromonas sp. Pch-P]